MQETLDTSALVIRIPGDILSTNAEIVRELIFTELRRIEGAPRDVTIDLSQATMVDSVGLNLLVAVIKHTKRNGGCVKLLCKSQNLERTFRFTRLDSQATVVRA